VSKVAAIQMCSSKDVDENLESAKKLIAEAARNQARLIVLPEMFTLIGGDAADKIQAHEKFGQGKVQSFLSEQAKSHEVYIVGGTTLISCDDENKSRAASLFYDDQGKLIVRYDKIHLFDVTLSEDEKYFESETIEAGDSLVIADTPFGRLGLAVCYDVRFPELFRFYFENQVDVITLPSAFTVPTGKAHWEILVRARAIENSAYVIAPAQAGTHANGRKTYGHSMIVAPWGEIAAEMNGEEVGIIYAEIDRNKIQEARKKIPAIHHRRIFIDTSGVKKSGNVYDNKNK
jgi:predicted amidohydrolase